MRQIFSIFCIVALGGVVAGVLLIVSPAEPKAMTATRRPVDDGDKNAITASGSVLIDSALAALKKHESIDARLRVQLQLLDQELLGNGSYVRQGRGAERKMRLDLSIQGAKGKNSLSQIRDGDKLWTYRLTSGKPSLSAVDLVKVRKAIASADVVDTNAELRVSGGLEQLISNIARNFEFEEAVQRNWKNKPVWALRGRWRGERLADLFPNIKALKIKKGRKINKGLDINKERNTKSGTVALDALPDRVPHEVLMYFDVPSLMPYRIELRHLPAPHAAQRSTPDGVAIDIYDVQLGIPQDIVSFRPPTEIAVADGTKDALKSLGIKNEK